MAKELAYVMINPYTISKSRTGGVIARCIGRTDLDLVAARMFAPSAELVEKYSDMVRKNEKDSSTGILIADYIREAYMPNPSTGRPQRVMLLLFEGEDAVRKIWEVTGSATANSASGQTIRDTYGDYILDDHGKVQYFEPAVLVAPTVQRAKGTLRLWAKYSDACGGVLESASDSHNGEDVQKTLVMLKPDNFRIPSLRAGNIIDILSRSGLRIIAVKKFHMSVPQAEEFYGPVIDALTSKFEAIGSGRAARTLSKEFEFDVTEEEVSVLCRELGPKFARAQFESIVEFITGCRPSEYKRKSGAMGNSVRSLWTKLSGNDNPCLAGGHEGCLAMVYEGHGAVSTIRDILGPTDPSKAQPGSVRREFGSDIMVNAAHASDSPENAQREIGIIDVQADTVKPWVMKYCGRI
jgi:nucleoside diphosphate kinase